MKQPSATSLKRVTPGNLARLGAERLSQLLVSAAETRPDLKRLLRMELAAEQGAEHLAVEIDKRLASLDASRAKVSWRKRASFISDLDALRALIVERMASLDAPGALARLWTFMDLARRLGTRVRDRDGALGEVFVRAAKDIGDLLTNAGSGGSSAEDLVNVMALNPASWSTWLPLILARTERTFAGEILQGIAQRSVATPAWLVLARAAADAARDVNAFQATFTPAALRTPSVAAELARRLLAADRVSDAGSALEAAAPRGQRVPGAMGTLADIDFDWETVWIDYLERTGRPEEAQAARWASFERTLSIERARAFVRRLTGFDDVEAESRAFERAAADLDAARALRFLIEWPAHPEAAHLVQTRAEEMTLDADLAELWASKLRLRQPIAAHILLRKAAAAALKRRDLKTSERLSQEADTIDLPTA